MRDIHTLVLVSLRAYVLATTLDTRNLPTDSSTTAGNFGPETLMGNLVAEWAGRIDLGRGGAKGKGHFLPNTECNVWGELLEMVIFGTELRKFQSGDGGCIGGRVQRDERLQVDPLAKTGGCIIDDLSTEVIAMSTDAHILADQWALHTRYLAVAFNPSRPKSQRRWGGGGERVQAVGVVLSNYTAASELVRDLRESGSTGNRSIRTIFGGTTEVSATTKTANLGRGGIA